MWVCGGSSTCACSGQAIACTQPHLYKRACVPAAWANGAVCVHLPTTCAELSPLPPPLLVCKARKVGDCCFCCSMSTKKQAICTDWPVYLPIIRCTFVASAMCGSVVLFALPHSRITLQRCKDGLEQWYHWGAKYTILCKFLLDMDSLMRLSRQ